MPKRNKGMDFRMNMIRAGLGVPTKAPRGGGGGVSPAGGEVRQTPGKRKKTCAYGHPAVASGDRCAYGHPIVPGGPEGMGKKREARRGPMMGQTVRSRY
jgi:hypothetical protein